jgi:hypothetical protein
MKQSKDFKDGMRSKANRLILTFKRQKRKDLDSSNFPVKDKNRAVTRENSAGQGCQMVYFQTKNSDMGTFGTALQWKTFVCFMDIWSILRPFDMFYGHLVYFVGIT